MKNRFWVIGLLWLAFPLPTARADLGFWSARLVGTWRHPKHGDQYQFRSDATYTFWAGASKRRAGNLSHRGFWKVVAPTFKESGGSQEGPVALLLKSTSRVVLEAKKPRVLRSQRVFRIVSDTIRSKEGMIDPNRYRIGGATWRRAN